MLLYYSTFGMIHRLQILKKTNIPQSKQTNKQAYSFMEYLLQIYTNFTFCSKYKMALRKADHVQRRSYHISSLNHHKPITFN